MGVNRRSRTGGIQVATACGFTPHRPLCGHFPHKGGRTVALAFPEVELTYNQRRTRLRYSP